MSAIPRTIYVKVSTVLLAELHDWSDPVRVKIRLQPDLTYEMIFLREDPVGISQPQPDPA